MREMNKPEQGTESIKALTLYQPWAQLVSLGVKTIETRSWSTRYRGPLAIHASVRTPLKRQWFLGDYYIGRKWVPLRDAHGLSFVLYHRSTDYDKFEEELCFGAIVAIAELVDVVPIVPWHGAHNSSVYVCDLTDFGKPLSLWYAPTGTDLRYSGNAKEISDQLPYGDFTPGRFAWILENVRLIDPLPAKGKQGLWEFEMEES